MLEAFDFVPQKPEHLKQTSTETLPGDPKTYSFKGHYNYLEAHTLVIWLGSVILISRRLKKG